MIHFHSTERVSGISIVIPARGRLALLLKLMDSIAEARKKIPAIDCEAIVVWDGTENPTEDVINFSNSTGLKIRCLFVEAGPAMKRNVGMAAAQYNVALCVDSDCTIHPKLLVVIAEAFKEPDIQALAVPVKFETPQGRLETATAAMPYRQTFNWAERGERLWWVPAATIALRLSTVERLGGFWSVGCGPDRAEDVDLGLRWTERLGFPAIVTAPNCPSVHARETWSRLREALGRAWYFGTSEGYLWRRHPSFCRRSIPPILAFAVVLAIAAVVTVFAFPLSLRLLTLSVLLFFSWCAVELLKLHCLGLTPAAVPAWLSQSLIFDLARTFSLWRSGTLTGGIWFHHQQAIGEWWVLVANGWLLLGVGIFLWFLSLVASWRC